MSKSQKTWIAVGVSMVVIIAIVLVVASIRSQNASSSSTATYQTTTVQIGTLTSTVEGTGTVASILSTHLTWLASGQVNKVLAHIGSQVKTGDVLATLLLNAQTQNTLESNLATAQGNLAQLTSPSAIASAQATVASDEQAITTAQRNVANLDYHSQSAIDNAAAALVLAQSSLDKAQANYDNFSSLPDDDTIKATTYQTLYGAQEKYKAALNTYNAYIGHPNQATIDSTNAALALAIANLAQDINNLAALTGGNVPADATGASLLKLRQAQLAVQTAQENLDETTITAPFDGTITQSTAVQQDIVSPGAQAFRIDDLSNLVISVQVVEIDINHVQIGQTATITFDAIPNKTYTGTVTKTDLSGTVAQNSVTFSVTVQLTDADALVKPGMGANVTIVTNRVENALLVPSTSIFTDGNGQQYVYLIQNGVSTTVPVTIGAVSDSTTQITNDTLKEGDTIVLSFASTASTTGGGMFGMGGGGRLQDGPTP